MLHKCCFWVRHIFGNYLWKLYFPKNYCVVTLMYMTIYEKCIIVNIAYRKMHEYLAWKRKTSLIKFLRMDFMDLLHYLQNLKML